MECLENKRIAGTAFLVLALFFMSGCYDNHPEYERFYNCNVTLDCLPGYECVSAGSRSVCSSKTGCGLNGCPQGQACLNGGCYVCDHSNCELAVPSKDVIEHDVFTDAPVTPSDVEVPHGDVIPIDVHEVTTDTGLDSEIVCMPDCGDHVCGVDPVCGRSCGKCATDWWCDIGACKDDCTGLECGNSPHLGVSCGTCNVGYGCRLGDCVKTGDMVLIPAGSFWMGCNSAVDSQCSTDESPYHQVTLSAYYMDKTEVTVAAYEECVIAGACSIPSTYGSCNWQRSGRDQHPVNCLSWNQATAYCAWVEKQLPTEAQWEKAARGTDGRKYPWGNQTATCNYAIMDDDTQLSGCGTQTTWVVCSKSPAGDSPYGLCDMAGNVWEWVSDWYDGYSSSPLSNPAGPDTGAYRVFRGGSFYYVGGWLRVSARNNDFPSGYGYGYAMGFRCSRSQ